MPSSLTITEKQLNMPLYLIEWFSEWPLNSILCPWIWSRVLTKSIGNVKNSAVQELMPPKINGSNAFSGIYLKSAYETNKVKISTVQEIKKS